MITGIEIRQPPWSGNCPVGYYFGSSGSYSENNTYATEETAQSVAKAKQQEYDAKKSASPEVLQSGRFAGLTLRDAIITRQHDSLWDSWWVARHLLDDLEGWTDEEKRPTSKEDIGYMWDDLSATVKRLRAGKHYTSPGPFIEFMDWLESHIKLVEPIDPFVLAVKIDSLKDHGLTEADRAQRAERAARQETSLA